MRPDDGDSSGCRLRGACSVRPEPEATAATEQHSQASSLIGFVMRGFEVSVPTHTALVSSPSLAVLHFLPIEVPQISLER